MRKSTPVLLLLLAFAALTACSDQPDATAPKVATVAGGTAQPSSQSAAAAANERPIVRSDMTNEEEDRLWATWKRCLDEHGVPEKDYKRLSDNPDPAAKAAFEACANLEPETPWQRSKRLDPAYGDKLRDWVTCIRAAGIDAWEDNGFLAFNSLPSDEQQVHVDECQRKVFGA
ncbi:hypothetical protein AB0K00_27295 [Dactylosporangium sp. NPDC049525]|uniref:hypothetical protein n=1 Tax=Dactylosporangium sp. NPDC049525 TaxID=3154730 RepID=UPI00341DC58E